MSSIDEKLQSLEEKIGIIVQNVNIEILSFSYLHKNISELTKQCNNLMAPEQIRSLSSICLKYIDCMESYINSLPLLGKKNIQFIKERLAIIADISKLDSVRPIFLKFITASVFQKITNSKLKLWFRLELLNNFNLAVLTTPSRLRYEIIEAHKSYLSKLAQAMCECGDYTYQLGLLVTIFFMCSGHQIVKYATILFPTSTDFQSDITLIKKKNFDADARIFLNKVNSQMKKVLSLKCERMLLGNIEVKPPMWSEHCKAVLWIDFNLDSKRMTVFCDQRCLQTIDSQSEEDTNCESIIANVTDIQHVSMTGLWVPEHNCSLGYTFRFSLCSPCSVLHASSQEATDTTIFTISFYTCPEVIELIDNILPDWFGEKFQIITKTYKPSSQESHQKDNDDVNYTGSTQSSKIEIRSAGTQNNLEGSSRPRISFAAETNRGFDGHVEASQLTKTEQEAQNSLDCFPTPRISFPVGTERASKFFGCAVPNSPVASTQSSMWDATSLKSMLRRHDGENIEYNKRVHIVKSPQLPDLTEIIETVEQQNLEEHPTSMHVNQNLSDMIETSQALESTSIIFQQKLSKRKYHKNKKGNAGILEGNTNHEVPLVDLPLDLIENQSGLDIPSVWNTEELETMGNVNQLNVSINEENNTSHETTSDQSNLLVENISFTSTISEFFSHSDKCENELIPVQQSNAKESVPLLDESEPFISKIIRDDNKAAVEEVVIDVVPQYTPKRRRHKLSMDGRRKLFKQNEWSPKKFCEDIFAKKEGTQNKTVQDKIKNDVLLNRCVSDEPNGVEIVCNEILPATLRKGDNKLTECESFVNEYNQDSSEQRNEPIDQPITNENGTLQETPKKRRGNRPIRGRKLFNANDLSHLEVGPTANYVIEKDITQNKMVDDKNEQIVCDEILGALLMEEQIKPIEKESLRNEHNVIESEQEIVSSDDDDLPLIVRKNKNKRVQSKLQSLVKNVPVVLKESHIENKTKNYVETNETTQKNQEFPVEVRKITDFSNKTNSFVGKDIPPINSPKNSEENYAAQNKTVVKQKEQPICCIDLPIDDDEPTINIEEPETISLIREVPKKQQNLPQGIQKLTKHNNQKTLKTVKEPLSFLANTLRNNTSISFLTGNNLTTDIHETHIKKIQNESKLRDLNTRQRTVESSTKPLVNKTSKQEKPIEKESLRNENNVIESEQEIFTSDDDDLPLIVRKNKNKRGQSKFQSLAKDVPVVLKQSHIENKTKYVETNKTTQIYEKLPVEVTDLSNKTNSFVGKDIPPINSPKNSEENYAAQNKTVGKQKEQPICCIDLPIDDDEPTKNIEEPETISLIREVPKKQQNLPLGIPKLTKQKNQKTLKSVEEPLSFLANTLRNNMSISFLTGNNLTIDVQETHIKKIQNESKLRDLNTRQRTVESSTKPLVNKTSKQEKESLRNEHIVSESEQQEIVSSDDDDLPLIVWKNQNKRVQSKFQSLAKNVPVVLKESHIENKTKEYVETNKTTQKYEKLPVELRKITDLSNKTNIFVGKDIPPNTTVESQVQNYVTLNTSINEENQGETICDNSLPLPFCKDQTVPSVTETVGLENNLLERLHSEPIEEPKKNQKGTKECIKSTKPKRQKQNAALQRDKLKYKKRDDNNKENVPPVSVKNIKKNKNILALKAQEPPHSMIQLLENNSNTTFRTKTLHENPTKTNLRENTVILKQKNVGENLKKARETNASKMTNALSCLNSLRHTCKESCAAQNKTVVKRKEQPIYCIDLTMDDDEPTKNIEEPEMISFIGEVLKDSQCSAPQLFYDSSKKQQKRPQGIPKPTKQKKQKTLKSVKEPRSLKIKGERSRSLHKNGSQSSHEFNAFLETFKEAIKETSLNWNKLKNKTTIRKQQNNKYKPLKLQNKKQNPVSPMRESLRIIERRRKLVNTVTKDNPFVTVRNRDEHNQNEMFINLSNSYCVNKNTDLLMQSEDVAKESTVVSPCTLNAAVGHDIQNSVPLFNLDTNITQTNSNEDLNSSCNRVTESVTSDDIYNAVTPMHSQVTNSLLHEHDISSWVTGQAEHNKVLGEVKRVISNVESLLLGLKNLITENN